MLFSTVVTHLKNAIRKQILAKRDVLTKRQIIKLSDAVSKRLFGNPKFKNAKVVAFYLTKGSEVSTKKMILQAIKQGKEILVPVTRQTIKFYKFKSFSDLANGKFSIPEPESREKPSREPDVIIVPGVAFGFCMHRLGYGKGYYDSYLASSSAYRIGICFDFQLVEKLPTHKNDQKMDRIITEKRTIICTKKSNQ